MGDACSARTSTAFKPPRFQEFLSSSTQTTSDFRNPRSLCHQSQSDFRNPAPLMQNYMIKSVKMTKKSIFREQFSWKVRNFSHTRSYFRSKAQRKTRFPLVLCSLIRNFAQNLCENGLHLGKERALCTRFAPSLSHAFRKGCRSFCCSISHTNCDLERDLMSKSKCTLKLRTIAQTSTIVHLGLSQACVRVWDGGCAFFMPIPIVLPPTRL